MSSEICNPPDPTLIGSLGLFLLDWVVALTISNLFYGMYITTYIHNFNNPSLGVFVILLSQMITTFMCAIISLYSTQVR